jgi:hypothetical protein
VLTQFDGRTLLTDRASTHDDDALARTSI